jgi:hypothetical protein
MRLQGWVGTGLKPVLTTRPCNRAILDKQSSIYYLCIFVIKIFLKGYRMNKAMLLKILNPILFLLVVVQLTTIIMIRTISDPSPFIPMVHIWNSYAIGIVLVLHLFLNFGWIKANFFPKKK